MSQVSDRDRLLYMSRRYLWWTPAEHVVEHDVDHLIEKVMELGTSEDTDILFELFDLDSPAQRLLRPCRLATAGAPGAVERASRCADDAARGAPDPIRAKGGHMSRIIDQKAVDRGRDELSLLFHIELPALCIGPGWIPLVEGFLEEAARCGEIRDLTVSDIKEKFGTLSIHHDGSQHLDNVAEALEDRSAHICMACGDAGSLRHDGWSRTLCDSCEDLRRSQ